MEKYWFAQDLGTAGHLTPVVRCMLQRVVADPGLRALFIDVLSHRVRPSAVLSPSCLLAAAGTLLREGDASRLDVLHEVGTIVAKEYRRKRLARKPRYEPAPAAGGGAGP